MINLSELASSQPLIILRGEYGVIIGENALIASPNPKNGVLLVLSDSKNKITAMGHFDSEKNIEENLEKILEEMSKSGADILNLKCNLIENDRTSTI